MGNRPEDLPVLDRDRLHEIGQLLTHESSISFQSARAHESIWMLLAAAEERLQPAPKTFATAEELDEYLQAAVTA